MIFQSDKSNKSECKILRVTEAETESEHGHVRYR